MSIHYRIEHPETMYKVYWKEWTQTHEGLSYDNHCDIITFPQGHTFTTQDIKGKLSDNSSFILIDIQRL